jgi:formamidopyrimidine-DNA glycosylase
MPELPEIANLSKQLNQRLVGKTITAIEVLQPKCLNLPVEAFQAALIGATLENATYRGKWILVHADRGWLLFNLGMGGELLLVTPDSLPEKHRLNITFSDGTCLSVNFWWFGSAHYVPEDGLEQHPQINKLGPNALDLDLAHFKQLLQNQRGTLKTFLLDQSRIAGIGNFYVQDILFLARLHPLRKIPTLSEAEVEGLFAAIQQGLRPSLEKGGAFYEKDSYNNPGGFVFDDVLIGYRENQPCPICQTAIVKIKTGGTSSFVCPSCQK